MYSSFLVFTLAFSEGNAANSFWNSVFALNASRSLSFKTKKQNHCQLSACNCCPHWEQGVWTCYLTWSQWTQKCGMSCILETIIVFRDIVIWFLMSNKKEALPWQKAKRKLQVREISWNADWNLRQRILTQKNSPLKILKYSLNNTFAPLAWINFVKEKLVLGPCGHWLIVLHHKGFCFVSWDLDLRISILASLTQPDGRHVKFFILASFFFVLTRPICYVETTELHKLICFVAD